MYACPYIYPFPIIYSLLHRSTSLKPFPNFIPIPIPLIIRKLVPSLSTCTSVIDHFQSLPPCQSLFHTYIVPRTFCHVHYATYIMRRTLCHVHCATYTVRRTLCDVHYATYIVPRTLCDVYCATYIVSYVYCATYIVPRTSATYTLMYIVY